jgi:8-oxo-dGTP diphosphatase
VTSRGGPPAVGTPRGGRRYPDRPFVGVGAVVLHEGHVVLVRRRFEPLKGQWSLPGGAIDLGESLEVCVEREIREETGLEAEVGPVIEVFDRITKDADDRVEFHYVLVDYLCWSTGGALRPGSDAGDAVLADPADLTPFCLTDKAIAVIGRALELARGTTKPPRSAKR